MKPKLSILTPTIPGREKQLAELQAKIEAQAGTLPVEHLCFCDNKKRPIGAKRQALVDIARGDYVAFVDDDDDILPGYVEGIVNAMEFGPDVITFKQQAIYNGQKCEIEFGINQADERFQNGGQIKRGPWHVCAWRREPVRYCLFPETNYGEDFGWVQQARLRIKTGKHIDEVLHVYRHDEHQTAAPEPWKAD